MAYNFEDRQGPRNRFQSYYFLSGKVPLSGIPLFQIFESCGKSNQMPLYGIPPFLVFKREKVVEIETRGFNPKHTCRQFRHVKSGVPSYPTWWHRNRNPSIESYLPAHLSISMILIHGEAMDSGSAALCDGGDACI